MESLDGDPINSSLAALDEQAECQADGIVTRVRPSADNGPEAREMASEAREEYCQPRWYWKLFGTAWAIAIIGGAHDLIEHPIDAVPIPQVARFLNKESMAFLV